MLEFFMKDITLIFLILRKNGKLLKEFINNNLHYRSSRRKHIVMLKRKLASLQPSMYMLVKTIATELHRFEIFEVSRQFTKKQDIVNFVINGKVIMENIESTIRYGSNETSIDPYAIYDKVHGIYFIISENTTVVDDIVLFEGIENEWFKTVFYELRNTKDAEEKLLKQQKEHEEQQRLANRKENLLSKYYH